MKMNQFITMECVCVCILKQALSLSLSLTWAAFELTL